MCQSSPVQSSAGGSEKLAPRHPHTTHHSPVPILARTHHLSQRIFVLLSPSARCLRVLTSSSNTFPSRAISLVAASRVPRPKRLQITALVTELSHSNCTVQSGAYPSPPSTGTTTTPPTTAATQLTPATVTDKERPLCCIKPPFCILQSPAHLLIDSNPRPPRTACGSPFEYADPARCAALRKARSGPQVRL